MAYFTIVVAAINIAIIKKVIKFRKKYFMAKNLVYFMIFIIMNRTFIIELEIKK